MQEHMNLLTEHQIENKKIQKEMLELAYKKKGSIEELIENTQHAIKYSDNDQVCCVPEKEDLFKKEHVPSILMVTKCRIPKDDGLFAVTCNWCIIETKQCKTVEGARTRFRRLVSLKSRYKGKKKWDLINKFDPAMEQTKSGEWRWKETT